MNLHSSEFKINLNESTNSALMLNAACQGIIESYIQPSASPWYKIIKEELSEAQAIVKEWRTQGYLYFDQDILAKIIECGQAFMDSRQEILDYFDKLENKLDTDTKAKLLKSMKKLILPIRVIINSINGYENSLKSWGDKMQKIHNKLSLTIDEIQSQAADLHIEIQAINEKINELKKQIIADRKAISKAKEEEKKEKREVIIEIILAPFTGGISLILAGIGVSSIFEAEGKIASMQASISGYQKEITGFQQKNSDDEKKISFLNSITLTTSIVLNDVEEIDSSIDSLKIKWEAFYSEFNGIIDKISKSEQQEEIVISRAWFEAACNEWKVIMPHSESLRSIN